MKKLFFFASAMMAALTMNAQTITIDGDLSDWGNVPMITEPGTLPMLKYLLSNQENANVGEGNAFAVAYQHTEEMADGQSFCILLDADKSTETGNDVWFVPGMKKDYEMNQWTTGTSYVRNSAIGEMSVPTSAFSSLPFTGSFYGWLSYAWGVIADGGFYCPIAPDQINHKFGSVYQPVDVRPFAFADMNGTHLFADTWSRHEAVALADSMNFNVTGGAQDTAFWCAWTVEIPANATYQVSADMVSDDDASCDLYLVDIPTNTVVATLMSSETWQPTGETALGEWNLSAIPAGKYMLKAKNHVAWSHMKLVSVKLVGPSVPTGDEQIQAAEAAPIKMIRNGRFMINHNGKFINALGF